MPVGTPIRTPCSFRDGWLRRRLASLLCSRSVAAQLTLANRSTGAVAALRERPAPAGVLQRPAPPERPGPGATRARSVWAGPLAARWVRAASVAAAADRPAPGAAVLEALLDRLAARRAPGPGAARAAPAARRRVAGEPAARRRAPAAAPVAAARRARPARAAAATPGFRATAPPAVTTRSSHSPARRGPPGAAPARPTPAATWRPRCRRGSTASRRDAPPKQSVLVQGSGSMSANTRVSVASYTVLNVCGTINVTGTGSGDQAPIYARGQRDIEIPHVDHHRRAALRDVLPRGRQHPPRTDRHAPVERPRRARRQPRQRSPANQVTQLPDRLRLRREFGDSRRRDLRRRRHHHRHGHRAQTSANAGLLLNDTINAEVGAGRRRRRRHRHRLRRVPHRQPQRAHQQRLPDQHPRRSGHRARRRPRHLLRLRERRPRHRSHRHRRTPATTRSCSRTVTT